MKREPGTSTIIHIFAALHALVAACCLWAGVDDEMLLTVLTMTMTLIICLKRNLSVEICAIFMILVNIAGYFLGTGSGKLLESIYGQPYFIKCVATALTTEILGWVSYLIASFLQKDAFKDQSQSIGKRMNLIIVAVVTIFVLRITYVTFLTTNRFSHATILYILKEILSDSACMVTLLGLNIIFISQMRKFRKRLKRPVRLALDVAFFLAATFMGTAIVNATFFEEVSHVRKITFLQVSTIMMMVELTLYSIIYLAVSSLWARQQATLEREKANWEKYRYLRLKQQVNPHFLFNSLNILDCLVCEEKTEQASTYIHKLASIYRYFLRNEDNPTIPLQDELKFSEQYLDLLQVRFQDGFQVQWDIPETSFNNRIIPCSLQMLLENAFKHNAVQADDPLQIRIFMEEDYICVSNNLHPKCSTPSTGTGQQYIRQQYLDLAGKEVVIDHTDKTYTVKLPLL